MSENGKVLIGYKGVKYGLQKSKKAPPPKPEIFGDESSEDESIARQVTREQEKQLNASKVAEAQRVALAEDSTVFEYDTVYDEIQKRKIDPRKQDLTDRKPKYIQALKQKAEIRKKEQDIAYERRLLKERKADDHLYTQKDAFITQAYKNKLMEDKYWIAREKAMDEIEEKEDVTKKSDLTGFYKNLCTRNVAFGSNLVKDPEQPAPEPQPLPQHLHEIVQDRVNSSMAIRQKQDFSNQKQDSERQDSEEQDFLDQEQDTQKQDLQEQDFSEQKQDSEKQVLKEQDVLEEEQDPEKQDLQKQDVSNQEQEIEKSEIRKKRRNDEISIASARERYLARKKHNSNL